jgi:hypothetical protein
LLYVGATRTLQRLVVLAEVGAAARLRSLARAAGV